MNTKKSIRADLENKRFIFFEIGCVVSLVIVLLGFNMKTHEKQKFDLMFGNAKNAEEEMVAITEQQPPPPPSAPQLHSTILQVITDESEEATEDIEINAEADQNTPVEEFIPYQPVDVEEDEEEPEDIIFVVVESMPSFPGGEEARINYLNKNLNYPVMAREAGIEGTVYLTFVVEKDGSITGVRVLRGIGGGCDEEAVRVVQEMPRWIPGKQRNVPVRVQFNLPIRFMLM